jgi:hypothetical protein
VCFGRESRANTQRCCRPLVNDRTRYLDWLLVDQTVCSQTNASTPFLRSSTLFSPGVHDPGRVHFGWYVMNTTIYTYRAHVISCIVCFRQVRLKRRAKRRSWTASSCWKSWNESSADHDDSSSRGSLGYFYLLFSCVFIHIATTVEAARRLSQNVKMCD